MAKMSYEKLAWVLAMIVILTVLLATWKRSAILQDSRNDHSSVEYGRHHNHLCQPLRFYNTSSPNDAPPLTALFSLPGCEYDSWIRHLLQQATGIYIGSKQSEIKQKEFLGDASVLCITTSKKPDNKYGRAVILMRKDTLVAEFRRLVKMMLVNNVGTSESFETEALKPYLLYRNEHFRILLRSWVHDFKGRKFVVFYEDLKDNLLPTLNGVVRFLTGTDIPNTVKRCILQNGQGDFLPKESNDFDPYSSVRHLIPEINQMETQLLNEVQECVKAGRCEGG